MNQEQRKVLWTTCTSHGLIHVYELSIPALLILIQTEFGVGDLRMGEVVTLYGLLFGIGSLPAGWLVDRLGSRVLLVACLWGASFSLLGMAVSPSLALFSVCSAAMGLALSIYHPAGTALITHRMPATGRVFAWHGMAGNTGVATASVIAGSLGALVGWRWALGLLSMIGLGVGAVALRLPPPTIQDEPERPRGGHRTSFLLLLLAAAFMGMVYRGVTTFLPKLFATSYAENSAAGTAVGGALTTITLIVGLVGMYTAGRIADRGVRPALVFLAGAAFQAPFLVAIGVFQGPILLPMAMGLAFFHFLTQPVGNQMVSEFTPPTLRGLGYGIYFFMTFGAGSLGATISGWVSERIDLATIFPALALVLVPSIVLTAILAIVTRRAAVPSAR
jgi:MFS family permease